MTSRFDFDPEILRLRFASRRMTGEYVIPREVTRGIHAPRPCGAALRAVQNGNPAI